jgi:phospho-N-acetylmuramoyl-pentapeptide-transferase
MLLSSVIKVFSLTALAFLVAVAAAPPLIRFLRDRKLGKRIRDEAAAPVMAKLHNAKAGTPTMGGILVWGTLLVLIVAFYYLGILFEDSAFTGLSFLSRPQTYLPLGALIASALVGLVDDYWNILKIGPKGGGLRMRHRIGLYTAIAAIGALWFYYKLGWDLLRVPFLGSFNIGWWYMPVFVIVIVATSFSVNEADGLDGLAGGLLLTAFAAYGAIAFVQGKVELAAFCGVIVGALTAFLWYNIHPARFFMGDTGAMSLGVTLGVVAMLTNAALLLPVIGLMFVVESLSVLIQVASKRIRKKKLFLSSPLHHHLEATGWTEPQIVMRFWIVGGITAVIGLVIALVDSGFAR